MSTSSEPETTPPPPAEPKQSPIPSSIANNQYMKGALDNPYGQIGTSHPADVPVGIILMVLGALSAFWLLRIGFLLGTVLAGMFMFYALIGIVCAVGTGVGGYGIYKGARWGFMLVAASGVIGLVFSVLYMSPMNLVVDVAGAVYCFLRLTGQLKA